MAKWLHREPSRAPITLPEIGKKPRPRKRPPTLTPEQRKAASDRLKALHADPEFRRKRSAAAVAAMKARWANPETRKIMESNLKDHETRRLAKLRIKMDEQREERSEKARAKLKELWASGEMAQRMKGWKLSPEGLVKRRAATRRMHDAKRGFKVPRIMWSQYTYLVQVKKLSAREAGRILRIIP